MKFRVPQEALGKGLSIVGRAVNPRSSLPILGNVLLEASADGLRICATNLQLGVNCWVGAEVDEPGKVTVPAKLLTAFVNSLPEANIEAELNATALTLGLSCAGYRSNIRGMPAEDYPNVGKADNELLMRMEVGTLRGMVEQVTFAASRDESRPSLSGVELRYHPQRFSLAATDGYRLSVRRLYGDLNAPDGADTVLIVPASSLAEVARIAGDCEPDEALEVLTTGDRNQVLFDLPGSELIWRAEVVSQLVSGKYPDYSGIIPTTHKTSAEADRGDLLASLRVVALFAKQGSGIFRMEFGGTGIALSAEQGEIGDSANTVDADVTGDALAMHFNVAYWIDVLSRIDDERVVITATEAGKPATVRPAGMAETEFVHVIMPMSVR